ncbi:MAG: hypothetical protein HQL75_13240 [Magnetococcales bacterium]|nr:hypothetical protein [Magnetococcales bacterium]
MNNDTSNVVISGGTTTQQSIISSAHATAISYLQTAIDAVGTSGTTLTQWFGDNSSSAQSQVSTVLTQTLSGLQNNSFVYNLTDDLTYSLAFLEVVLIFNAPDSTTDASSTEVDVALWDQFWPMQALNADNASSSLVFSLLHQACLWFNISSIDELDGTQSQDLAQQFASANPTNALLSVRNHVYYVLAASNS